MSFDLGVIDDVCVGLFGTSVSYTPNGGSAVDVFMILDSGEQVQAINPGTFYLAFVRLADLPGDPKTGDEVTVGSKNFRVAKVEPADSAGGVRLHLHYTRP